jgi:hypothetical protein
MRSLSVPSGPVARSFWQQCQLAWVADKMSLFANNISRLRSLSCLVHCEFRSMSLRNWPTLEIRGCAIRLIGRRRLTLALVGEPRYFNIAELKLPKPNPGEPLARAGARRHRGRNERESKELCRPGELETHSETILGKRPLDHSAKDR